MAHTRSVIVLATTPGINANTLRKQQTDAVGDVDEGGVGRLLTDVGEPRLADELAADNTRRPTPRRRWKP